MSDEALDTFHSVCSSFSISIKAFFVIFLLHITLWGFS